MIKSRYSIYLYLVTALLIVFATGFYRTFRILNGQGASFDKSLALYCGAMGIMAAVILITEPKKLYRYTFHEHSFTVHTVLRRWEIPYQEITGLTTVHLSQRFSFGKSTNEVTKIHTGSKTFQLSEQYISNYAEVKEFLTSAVASKR